MATPSFQGWVGLNPESAFGHLVQQDFEPKAFTDNDIDIKITHSGLDGTDLLILRSGLGPTNYPVIAGHEFVGEVIKVGQNITNIKIGDRVGIGGQSGSCLRSDCESCENGSEQYCKQIVWTYGGNWPSGEKTYGGFAKVWRGDARFAIKIPDGLPSNEAASMMCGGITVYAPMKQHDVGPGKRVGIVGIGGLGHFGLLFAKALGVSKIYAISRTDAKKADALSLGATDFIATGEGGWDSKYANSLDMIINTVSSPEIPLNGYLNLLDTGGVLVQVGATDSDLPGWFPSAIIRKQLKICGSFLGSRAEMRKMLELVAEKKVHPWVEDRPMTEINQALLDFEAGKVRYRIVLHT